MENLETLHPLTDNLRLEVQRFHLSIKIQGVISKTIDMSRAIWRQPAEDVLCDVFPVVGKQFQHLGHLFDVVQYHHARH